ncbi:MAG: DUF1553 domain-containing protein [Candidatus Sumerlaeia bacterium]
MNFSNLKSKLYPLLGAMLFLAILSQAAAQPDVNRPFEKAARGPMTELDHLVMAGLQKKGIQPANPCSDLVFFRRAYLDLIGTLPEAQEAWAFMGDTNPEKRAKLIDDLLERDEYADYWSLKWCDILRVKAEFPINLWPNGVQAYHRWVHTAIKENMPYDRFAWELLTSSGSNFRVPQVNFYRAMQGAKASTIAECVGLTFMGVRLTNWPEKYRDNMEAFFSRVAFKGTAEWKESVVFFDPATTSSLKSMLPDGKLVVVEPDQDPRQVFTHWLVQKDNPWFAKNAVNRYWFWLMGRGIVHEPDDFRVDNPASNPELLDYLAAEFVESGYDPKHIIRLIANSQTYQQSCIPKSDSPEAETLFAFYPPRRLDAEVLLDAINQLTNGRESYSSAIPEPFTFIPETQRTILLADGSITSQYLEMFGRPSRDTGMLLERNNELTEGQRLYLINSTELQDKLNRSWKFRNAIRIAKADPRKMVNAIYMMTITRPATDEEFETLQAYFDEQKLKGQKAAVDLAWSLINSKEFLYRH